MSNAINTPEIRFEGYTDAWEQRKLEDFYQRAYSGGTPAATNEEFYGGDIPFMGISDIKHRYITKAGKSITEQGLLSSTARMVPKGAITLAMYASVGKVGITMIEVATSQAFFNLIFEFDETRDFVYTRLGKAELEKEWEQLISTGTQRNLNAQKIKEWLISFPGLKEQARIGDYFRHLDDHITLHQRKLLKLKNLKKAMIEKMFPRNGSNVPEIRFSGFTDAWEQRKLKDLVQFSKGMGYSKSDVTEIGIPIILYGRLYTSYETVISCIDTFAIPKPGSVYSKGGEVIVPASGESSEDIAIASVVNESGVLLGGDLNVITPGEKLDPAFLAISISNGKPHDDMARRAQGKSIVHLRNSDLEKIDLLFPIEEEQVAISSFLQEFDNLIALYRRKLDNMKNIKKSLLEKMFV